MKHSYPISLLLLYFGLRLHRLMLFPIFIDEAFHIRWARETLGLHPFGGVPDGKPLIAWVLAPLWPVQNALWVSRAGLVLVGVLGLAALFSLGRYCLGHRTAWVAALVYTLLPFTFFFERLALADPLAANLGLVAAWLIVKGLMLPAASDLGQGRLSTLRHAVPAGIGLALALLSKLPMLVYLAVPLLAWLVLARRRAAITSLVGMYLVCAVMLTPIVLLGRQTGDFGLGNAQRFTSTATITLMERLVGNAILFGQWLGVYIGWPLLLLGSLGIAWALLRRDRKAIFLVGLFVLPTGEFWAISTYPVSRYYLLGIGSLILLAIGFTAWGMAHLSRLLDGNRRPPLAGWVAALIGLMIILPPMLRFIHTAYTDPAALPLTAFDQLDYIGHSTAGFGLVEAAGWLADYADHTPTTVICVDFITCERLAAYLASRPGLAFARSDILTPAWLAAELVVGRAVVLAQDDPPQTAPFDPGNEYRLEAVGRFERPGGRTAFTLHRIALYSAGPP